MMFCPYCGTQIPDGSHICGNCGKELPRRAQAAKQTVNVSEANPPSVQQVPQAPPQPAAPAVNDSGSIGWAILGFLFPIVGLVLFLVWKNTKPNSSKKAGMGALVGFVVGLIGNIAIMGSAASSAYGLTL